MDFPTEKWNRQGGGRSIEFSLPILPLLLEIQFYYHFFFFWSRFAISSFLQFVAFLTGLHLVQSTIYKLNLSALLQWPPSAYLSRTPLMLQTRTVRHWNFLTVLSYKMVVQRIQNMCIFLERPQNKHTQLNYHGGLTGLQEYTLEF